MTKCKYANKYRAKRKPTCLKGTVCAVCAAKWAAR